MPTYAERIRSYARRTGQGVRSHVRRFNDWTLERRRFNEHQEAQRIWDEMQADKAEAERIRRVEADLRADRQRRREQELLPLDREIADARSFLRTPKLSRSGRRQLGDRIARLMHERETIINRYRHER